MKEFFKKLFRWFISYFKDVSEEVFPYLVKVMIEMLAEELGHRVMPKDAKENEKRFMIKARMKLSQRGFNTKKISDAQLQAAMDRALFVMRKARVAGKDPIDYYNQVERV